MFECPLWSVPPDLHIGFEAVVGEEARRQVDGEGTDAGDESEIISVGGLLSLVGGCDLEGIILEEAVGRAGLISETDTTLFTAGLQIC